MTKNKKPRKTLEQHLETGTYRADRHGSLAKLRTELILKLVRVEAKIHRLEAGR